MCNHRGMDVRVLYFAVVRDRAGGISEEALTLPEGATVAALAELVAARHPDLAGLMGSVRFAVNEAFAGAETPLEGGDEVAVIPPVSGG